MTHPANLPYTVVYTRAADRQLRKLPAKDAESVKAAVVRLAHSGEGDVKKLKGGGPFRLRVGSYRVFFDIQERTLAVLDIERRTGNTY